MGVGGEVGDVEPLTKWVEVGSRAARKAWTREGSRRCGTRISTEPSGRSQRGKRRRRMRNWNRRNGREWRRGRGCGVVARERRTSGEEREDFIYAYNNGWECYSAFQCIGKHCSNLNVSTKLGNLMWVIFCDFFDIFPK
jgi:hypothetical protein